VTGTQPLQAAAGIGNISEPSLAVVSGRNTTISTFAFSLRRTGREFFTGLSFVNSGTADATMTASFIGDDGQTVSTITLSVPHGTQLVGTLASLFPEAQGNGYIYIRSTAPVMPIGVDGRATNTALGTREPIPASANFVVPPLTKFLAVGTVLDQSVGVPNVAIRLSGPVQAATLTDAAGTYVFNDLPPGSYTLTPIPIGYTIRPSQINFTISNNNSRNNNFVVGLTQPVLTTIAPDGAVVNSDSVAITATGTNFIQGNVIVFETTELPTTFVSDTTLTAVIDRSLLTASGAVAVVVRNRGPSGSIVDSAPLTFTVGNPPPTLVSVTGQPNPLIAGSVKAPFTITVNGSGFTPATQVQVNGVGRVTTFVSPTQLTAVVQPSDVTTPGLVPITVRNPGGPSSAPFNLPVLYSNPVVTSIAPSTITAPIALDAQPVQLLVIGSGFIQDPTNASNISMVLVNGVPVPTQFISSTQLIGIVPAALVSSAGVAQVSVLNPPPTLAPSDALPLFVSNPVPVISGLNTGPISYNPNSGETILFPVIINGSNFSADSVAWVNPPCDTLGFRRAQATTRNSSTQITATIPIRCVGGYQIQVRSPQPGGGTSNTVTLSVPAQ
jgi:hypothetical protein